jgi:hypothetical protein
MNDTSPRAHALVLELLRRKTSQQRVEMMGDMFSAARAFLATSLQAQGLVPGTVAFKVAVLDRMYGNEVSPAQRQRLIAHWREDEVQADATSG